MRCCLLFVCVVVCYEQNFKYKKRYGIFLFAVVFGIINRARKGGGGAASYKNISLDLYTVLYLHLLFIVGPEYP